MYSSFVIDVDPHGGVEAMDLDAMPLSFLGRRAVRRATEIRFDEDRQQWDIHLCVYEGDQLVGYSQPLSAKGFHQYDEARRVEVSWLNLCRLLSVDPTSPWGDELLGIVRHSP